MWFGVFFNTQYVVFFEMSSHFKTLLLRCSILKFDFSFYRICLSVLLGYQDDCMGYSDDGDGALCLYWQQPGEEGQGALLFW